MIKTPIHVSVLIGILFIYGSKSSSSCGLLIFFQIISYGCIISASFVYWGQNVVDGGTFLKLSGI